MNDKTRQWGSLPIIVLAALALAGYGYLGNLTRYLADDYCSHYYAAKLGLIGSVRFWYVNWSGRFSSYLFDWLVFARLFGPYGAHLVPPLQLAAWWVLTTAAAWLGLGETTSRGARLGAALAIGASLILAVIALSPNIPQSYFWLNGLRLYSLPLVAMTAFVAMYRAWVPRVAPGHRPWPLMVAAVVLLFLNGGLNEIPGGLQVLLLTCLIARHVRAHGWGADPRRDVLIAAWLGAVLAIVVVVIAPGNAIRKAGMPPSPGVMRFLRISIFSYLHLFHYILVSAQKLSALTAAMLVSAWVGTAHGRPVAPRWRTIAVTVAGALLLPLVCIMPAVYGYAAPPPARSISIAVFTLVTCGMIASFHLGGVLANRGRAPARLAAGLLIAATLVTLVASLLTLRWVDQNRGAYVEFAHRWDEVDARILAARAAHEPSVTIPRMDNWASVARPTDDPDFWVTTCASDYYGIPVIGPPRGNSPR